MDDCITELQANGYCVLSRRLDARNVIACRDAFWPMLAAYLAQYRDAPNRGPHRHFLPMPFTTPIFAPEFFFDDEVLRIVRAVMGERIVIDQRGCDTPLRGSTDQAVHADYQRALFEEQTDLALPPYMLVVSFGLNDIALADGPIEIAAGTHRMSRADGFRAVGEGEIAMQPIPLAIGDVLIRHPWTLHRGSPNTTDRPRALVTIRYVRRWATCRQRRCIIVL